MTEFAEISTIYLGKLNLFSIRSLKTLISMKLISIDKLLKLIVFKIFNNKN